MIRPTCGNVGLHWLPFFRHQFHLQSPNIEVVARIAFLRLKDMPQSARSYCTSQFLDGRLLYTECFGESTAYVAILAPCWRDFVLSKQMGQSDFHFLRTSMYSSFVFIISDINWNSSQSALPYNFIYRMQDSPVRQKHLPYPKDFGPPNFAIRKLSQDRNNPIYKAKSQIDVSEPSQAHSEHNPQRPYLLKILNLEEKPLTRHSRSQRPSFRQDLLQNPRFAFNENINVQDRVDSISDSMVLDQRSKQLQGRQTPLPSSTLCQPSLDISPIKRQQSQEIKEIIRFQSTGEINAKLWSQKERTVIDDFNSRNNHQQQPDTILSGTSMLQQYINLGNRSSRIPVFEPKQIKQLKQHIHSVTKRKPKHEIQPSNELIRDLQGKYEEETHLFDSQKKKNRSKTGDKIEISYKTSLSTLQRFAVLLSKAELSIRIPKMFTEDVIYQDQPKKELYQSAKDMFMHLKIPYDCLVIKRYYNCVMVICKNICLIWHYSGKRYLGGWQTEYLDEGVKHGLGLEWKPGKQVYYGQFKQNERHGLGAFKNSQNESYLGQWIHGKRAEKQLSERSSEESVEFGGEFEG